MGTCPQNVIAVIFDFDDTLTDDSTTKLLEYHGIDTNEFWGVTNKAKVEGGWDPALAYLNLLLESVGEGRSLGQLTNKRLRDFGAGLSFYPGIPGLFDDLRAIANNHTISHPSVEFYVISGGLEEVIAGSSIVSYLSAFRGCRLAESCDGMVDKVMNVVSFTDKTRYVFEINKGILGPRNEKDNPYMVNEVVAEQARRVPMSNMIYLGDGLTDVPCFSLIEKGGGQAFGVFDPKKVGSPKRAWEKLVAPRRVKNMNSPRYGEDDDLGALLRAAVTSMCMNLDVRTRTASLSR